MFLIYFTDKKNNNMNFGRLSLFHYLLELSNEFWTIISNFLADNSSDLENFYYLVLINS